MSIYDIDYNQQGRLLLPPSKRLPKWKAWIYSLLKPVQWDRDWFFDTYVGGAAYNTFDNTVYYSYGDRAVWFDNSVYECLNDNPELGSVSSPILAPDKWYKLQDCFIGLDERMSYNSQIIILERALNTWFRNLTATDQIYVQTNVTETDTVLLANTSSLTASMSKTSEFAVVYLSNTYSPLTQYDFTVFVPSALFTTLGSTTTDRENAIRNVVDQYKMAGMNYDVQTF